jgi:cytochrome bd ubiquinol oxidase subunit II
VASAFVLIWTALLAFAIFYYVVFDGFDLGVGILHGFAPDPAWRPVMMQSIAPVWDGNETWLVFGGLGLFAAFPLAFAIMIPAVYFPILIMLLSLVFRGVAFEFRFKHPLAARFWDRGFSVGSTIATFAQGLVLGSYIQGFRVDGRHFVGTSMEWLSMFSVSIGLGLTFGYGLLGSCWLVFKTEGALQQWARRTAGLCLIAVLVAIAGVSVWTPLAHPSIAHRWFSWPNIVWLAPVPALTTLLAWIAWRSLRRGYQLVPFMAAIGLFLMAFVGIGISLWPTIVPYKYTLWEAASSPKTQGFLLIGTLVLLPVILGYTGWSYWMFRGKVRGDVQHDLV